MHEPARRAHDAMAEPRTTVWWMLPPDDEALPPFPDALVAPAEVNGSPAAIPSLAHMLVRTQADLLCARPSEPALLADVDSTPWRGVGPFVQGERG